MGLILYRNLRMAMIVLLEVICKRNILEVLRSRRLLMAKCILSQANKTTKNGLITTTFTADI